MNVSNLNLRVGGSTDRFLFMGICASLLALSFFTLVFGCTNPAPDAGEFDDDGVVAIGLETPESDDVPVSSADEYEGRRGGILNFPGYYALIPDLVFVEYFDSMLVAELYSGLTRIVDSQSGFVRPDLADRWTVSDDGLSYEFVLRRNLKFSDGSPVTAMDFKWSWERALDPYNRSERAHDAFGNIIGADSIASGSVADLTGVEVIDDRTLRITLHHPQVDFPARIASPVAAVLKRENVEAWGYDLAGWWSEPQRVPVKMDVMPVGTGPFKLTKFDAHGTAVVERNEHYVHRQSYLDGVVFTMRFDDLPDYYDASSRGFDRGEFDIAFFRDEDSDRFDPDVGYVVGDLAYNEQPMESRFFAFNASLHPYYDIQFRRALVSATNAEAFTTGRSSQAAYSLLPPDMPGHDDALDVAHYDPVRAAEELARSSYAKEGETSDLAFVEAVWGWSETEVNALSDSWEEILGLELVYRTTYSPDLMAAYDANEIEMAYIRSVPGYPDPHVVLSELVSVFGQGNDSAEYAVAKEMLSVASTELDLAKRIELYAELERYVIEKALALPFEWFPEAYYVRVQPWVMDWEIPKYFGSTLKDVWFDGTAPERSLPLPLE